jgi:hypothetical protein
MDKFSFCEPVTAASVSLWHIRKLTSTGKHMGGGADTKALCGRDVAWDIFRDIPSKTSELDLVGRCCPKCKEIYLVRSMIHED